MYVYNIFDIYLVIQVNKLSSFSHNLQPKFYMYAYIYIYITTHTYFFTHTYNMYIKLSIYKTLNNYNLNTYTYIENNK